MSRPRLLFLALSLLLVLPILAGTILAAASDEPGGDSLYKYLTVFTEVLTRVRESYVETSGAEDLLTGALDGTADALDPFSLYVPAEAVESFAAARAVGLGRSGLLLLKEHGVMYVAGVVPGSPAALAGIELGDIVAEINGESTRLMPLWKSQQILAGPPGSAVRAQLIRLGEMHDTTFPLAAFEPPAPRLETVDGAAVLRISSFGAATARAVEGALRQAAEAGRDRLLLDLRGTAGGEPEAAFDTARLFAEGELGTLKRRGAPVATFSGDGPPLFRGRLVVLTDRGTLGAAELLASVLRQKARAKLVGERTFGYAGRQASAELSTGGRLFYTDAFYAGPDGTLLRGSLLPDVRVDGRVGFGEETPERDLVLERGLSVLAEEEVPAKKAA